MFKAPSWIVMSVLTVTATANAGTLFTDGFESGNLSTTQNGVRWIQSTATSVGSDNAQAGSRSLKFAFAGVPLGEDSFAEQRISMPANGEYWFKYHLYVPANYTHRSDGASNNKFLAVYQAPYLKENPGFQVNFSLQPNGSGGSNMEIHHYNGGIEGPVRTVANNFITSADKGAWMELIAQVRVPSAQGARDGIMKMWKNGTLVVNVTDLPSWGGSGKNYIDQAYLLGWSNSGFTQATDLYIDNFVLANSPLSVGVTPNPPTNVSAQ